jgi:hypothetical protein
MVDRRALELEEHASRIVLAQLAIAVSLSLLSDVSGFLPRLQVAATIISTGLLVLVSYEQIRQQRVAREHDWHEARRVAESTKATTWAYMMRLPPFHAADADVQFEHNYVKLRESADHLAGRRTGPAREAVVTPRMREVRDWHWEDRREFYLVERLQEQIDWYDRKANQNHRKSRWFGYAAMVTLFAAIAATLVRVVVPEFNVVGSATTIAASLLAWSQTRRFEELASTYHRTCEQLTQLRSNASVAGSELEYQVIVARSEGAIGQEHNLWVVRGMSETSAELDDDG